MTQRQLQMALAVASIAVVLTAAAMSRNDRWNFDFAQYKGPQRPEPRDEFRFVMVGDRTGGRVPDLMPQAFREINYLYPEFVISVGDLIDGPGPTPERINQFWKEFDDEVAILKSPFVYVPGNHDVWNTTSKGIYEARYGSTYRSFNYRGLHFITLDTEEFDEAGKKLDRIDGKQLEWLKDDIARNRDAKAILVLMHKPIWLTGGLAKAEEVWKGLPVYVFAGHVHRYSYQVINDIPHIILGAVAGGMSESGDAIGRFRHYMLVTVRDGKLNFGLIRLGGVLAPEVVLEEEQPGIRLLADAFAVITDEGDASGNSLLVARNPLGTPLKLQVQKASYTSSKPTTQSLLRGNETTLAGGESFQAALDGRSLSAPAGTATELKALVEFTNSQGQPQKMDFPIERHRRRVVETSRPAAAPTIDGDLSDWTDAAWQSIGESSHVVSGPTAWKGADDVSAQFALATDEQNVYVAVRVTDDTVAYHATMLDSDGIEIFTASPGKSAISFPRDADWHRLMIAPFAPNGLSPGDPAGPPRVVTSGGAALKPLEAAYRREAKGFAIELTLSKQQLGWTDRDANAQFDIAINDRDVSTRRESQLVWSGTARAAYSSRHYGRVVLVRP
jgi:hypothetical protein